MKGHTIDATRIRHLAGLGVVIASRLSSYFLVAVEKHKPDPNLSGYASGWRMMLVTFMYGKL